MTRPGHNSDFNPEGQGVSWWEAQNGVNGLPAPVHRRITVAVCWLMARRETLDSQEHYEDSYALSQEFREWLLCIDDHPRELRDSVLMVPQLAEGHRRPETDGLLEI